MEDDEHLSGDEMEEEESFKPVAFFDRRSQLGELKSALVQTHRAVVIAFHLLPPSETKGEDEEADEPVEGEDGDVESPDAIRMREWMEDYAADARETNQPVQFIALNPHTFPEYARMVGLQSLPAFTFWWRRTMLSNFSGTNKEKFNRHTTKLIAARENDCPPETPPPHPVAASGDSVVISRGRKVNIVSISLQAAPKPPPQPEGEGGEDPPEPEPVPFELIVAGVDESGRAPHSEGIVPVNAQQNRNKSIVQKDAEGDTRHVDVNLSRVEPGVTCMRIYYAIMETGKSVVHYPPPTLTLKEKERERTLVESKPVLGMQTNLLELGSIVKVGKGWTFNALVQPLLISLEQLSDDLVEGVPSLGRVGPNTVQIPKVGYASLSTLLPRATKGMFGMGWILPTGSPLTVMLKAYALNSDKDIQSMIKMEEPECTGMSMTATEQPRDGDCVKFELDFQELEGAGVSEVVVVCACNDLPASAASLSDLHRSYIRVLGGEDNKEVVAVYEGVVRSIPTGSLAMEMVRIRRQPAGWVAVAVDRDIPSGDFAIAGEGE